MKNLKRFFGALLTLVLSFLALTNINAKETGSITINDATSGKTYEIYKIFNLTYSGTTTKNVAYTIDSDWENFFKEDGLGTSFIVSENNEDETLNQITIGSETKYINITEDNVASFADKALEYVAKNKLDADDAKTANSETVEFTNLDLGYYLVYPQGATEVEDGYKSICSLTSTLPDVVVEIKATYPTIEKESDSTSYEVGTYATWTITGKVPDTTGYTKYTYQINDSWTKGLELDKENASFKVTIGETTITDVVPVYNSNNTGFSLTFDMTKYQDKIGEQITVTYKLLITEDAVDSNTTNNKAYLTYSNNPKDDTVTDTNVIEIPVYSAKIEVLKVDGDDNSIKLSGAEFVLKNEEGKYYHITSVETGHVTSFEWLNDVESASLFITNEEGIAVTQEGVITSFEGLKDGTYYLEEIKAPDGYNKLTHDIEITLSGTTENDRPIPVSQSLTVENNTGLELPSTGGMGTTLFIIIGSLLAGVSIIVLITNKRMSKEN